MGEGVPGFVPFQAPGMCISAVIMESERAAIGGATTSTLDVGGSDAVGGGMRSMEAIILADIRRNCGCKRSRFRRNTSSAVEL